MKYTIIILVIIIAIVILEELTKKSKPQNNTWNFNAYKLSNSIVTDQEMKLYKLLQKEIPAIYVICPKVGIKDFVQITEKKNYMKHFGHISQKHIDYLICEKETLKPVLGIELDDKSHQREDRKKRDESVNTLYENIGLRMLRIPTSINDDEIKRKLTKFFSPPIEMFN